MLASNPVSVKVPITSGGFTMVAKGQKHRVSLEVWGEGQITTLRVTCRQTGKEWFFDTFNGKLRRGFSPDGKLPNCELPAIKFEPARSSVPSPSQLPISSRKYEDWVMVGGCPYLVPSNEPPDDGFIYEDDEPSDLSRYSEPMSDPTTWQEF
jgi:hypothetical protein